MAAALFGAVEAQFKTAATELEKFKIVRDFQQKTHIKTDHLLIASSFLLFVILGLGWFGDLIWHLIAVAYPSYASFKAIETTRTDDDTQWLTYWVVFGFFTIINHFSSLLTDWIPFFYLFTTAFFIYLQHPNFRGAQVVYHKFLAPFLRQNEKKIDDFSDDVIKKVATKAD